MSQQHLSARERRRYREGGFRLGGRPRSEAEAERATLEIAIALLRAWGAGRRDLRASLAIPTARALGCWRRGETAIPPTVRERIAVILALYGRLVAVDDGPTVRPLPDLKRPGRAPLTGRALLSAGRLSDLLALWRQVALAEEAAAQRRRRRRQGRGKAGARR